MKTKLILSLLMSATLNPTPFAQLLIRATKVLTPSEISMFKNFCYLASHKFAKQQNYNITLQEYRKELAKINTLAYEEFQKTNLGSVMHSMSDIASQDKNAYENMYNNLKENN